MNPLTSFQLTFDVSTAYPQYRQFHMTPQNPMNLSSYLPSPYELTLARFKAFKIAQLKAMQDQNDVKQEPALKIEGLSEKIEFDIKTETSQGQTSQSSTEETPNSNSQPIPGKDLKTEIQKMLRFILSNMGKGNESVIEKIRNYYMYSPALLQAYDKLTMRYYSAKKCKEDIIRYILRKVFRSMRTSIMKEEQVSSKKASLILCKRHFYQHAQYLNSITNFENEDDLLESLMPFNKNSKNKTMNLNFVLEVFASKSFCEEYEAFLPTLNQIIVEEHKKKEEQLVGILLECIQKNNFSKLKGMSRLPWIDVWIEDAKNIAIGIMPNKRLIYTYKKPKI